MLNFVLYSEINILCAVLLTIMAVRASKYGLDSSPKKQTFVSAICFALFMNVSDCFWYCGFSKTLPFPAALMYVINTCYFTCFATSSYCWFIFSDTICDKTVYKSHKRVIIGVLPVILFAVLLATTPFTHLFYYFDESGVYHRGDAFYLQYVFAFGYTVIASIKNLVFVISKRGSCSHEDLSTLCSFAIPPVICGVLQIIFQDAPILSVCPTISFLLIYTASLRLQMLLDPLTGINNRRSLTFELSRRVKSVKRGKKLYFLFMDIDSFKSLNDDYGHHNGDRVLTLIADVLKELCHETNGVCARYGGDEFAFVQEINENENISTTCAKLKHRIRERCESESLPFPVTVSIGYAAYTESMDGIQDLIDFADERMYAKKAKKHTDSDR